jgi:hypothetical protein
MFIYFTACFRSYSKDAVWRLLSANTIIRWRMKNGSSGLKLVHELWSVLQRGNFLRLAKTAWFGSAISRPIAGRTIEVSYEGLLLPHASTIFPEDLKPKIEDRG